LQDTIRIRATQHGVSIVCDPNASIAELTGAIRTRLQSHAQFYRHADIKLNVGDRELETEDVATLREVLEKEFQLRLSGVVCSPDTLLKRFEREIGCAAEFPSSVSSVVRSDVAEEKPDPEPEIRFDDGLEETMIVRQTCRSGEKFSSPGSLVVLGNVNPSAEVVAQRDIVVMGVLRGNAHAGAGGNTDAVIIALALEPKQLRIAGHLGLPPVVEESHGRSGSAVAPEIAYVENNRIVLEPYTGRFPGA